MKKKTNQGGIDTMIDKEIGGMLKQGEGERKEDGKERIDYR